MASSRRTLTTILFGRHWASVVCLLALAGVQIRFGNLSPSSPATAVMALTALDKAEVNCGLSKLRGGSIINGNIAADGEFPYIVSLQYQDVSDNYHHFCGGTIISERWILTAAHCLEKFITLGSIESLSVVVGFNRLNNQVKGDRYRLERAVNHEYYNKDQFDYDIGIVRTIEPIKFRKTKIAYQVNAACLPPSPPKKPTEMSSKFPPPKATVIGWGATEYKNNDKKESNDLLKVDIELVDSKECKKAYKEMSVELSDSILCYGDDNKDACQGDSGGPLLKQIDRRTYLIGVISFGLGCGSYPGIYTDVGKYRQWIEAKIF